MAQTFNGGPITGAVASSLEIRQNNNSFLTSNSGPAVPGYAEEGMPWYNPTTKRLNIFKAYGDLAYGEWIVGNGINLAAAYAQPGLPGPLIDAQVRVRTTSIMAGADRNWEFTAGSPGPGGALTIDFNVTRTPAYFMARQWDDAVIGEPVLWSPDGSLLSKNWESIPGGFDENVYTNSPSVLAGGEPTSSLRAVDVEQKDDYWKWELLSASMADHIVIATTWNWWEVQSPILGQSLVHYDLLENGIVRHQPTFKVTPFVWGNVVHLAVYNVDPVNSVLAPFNPSSYYELRVRKDR